MKDEHSTYVLHFFKKWAPFYDVVDLFIRGIRERVFHFTDPEKEAKILDVCTGTGKQAFAFGKRGFEVIGIDLSEDMLRVAARKNRYENVRFEIGDAKDLPYRESHFDISCISFGLHEMPQPLIKKVLGEMVRVTKSQGKIIIVDYASPKGKIRNFLFYHFVRLYESKYFPEFIKADLSGVIDGIGLKLRGFCEWAFGCVKIWKYEK
ncbi:MAG: methyltransferase domain-containing protein [candidate division Zixibacteria bacterium]|nr:methyltransferase domain-containing protein [candidate division Zixibacteria bacterium]